ncbi:MAG: hypothetical protein ACI8S6_003763 [Myxococcota bacterium]|jgi:hypothetical protein
MFAELANLDLSIGQADRAGLRHHAAASERRVAPIFERLGGEIIKHTGDSFLVLFPAATDAVRAARAVLSAPSADGAVDVRVGIATGDVEVMSGDVFGEVVNLASRILSKAPLGQAWFSQATLLCMNQAEIAWESVGRFSLKGIAGEVELQRAVPEDRTWLPEAVTTAIRNGTLVRFQRGSPPPRLPPRCLILLEGFEPGSDALDTAISTIPVVDPASLWLVTYQLAATDRVSWLRSGRGLVISTAEGLDAALSAARRRLTSSSSTDTIIFDSLSNVAAELVLAGLALPAVPLSDVVAGYTYDLLPDGRWVNSSEHAVARVDVSPEVVSLQPLVRGLQIDGRQLQPGEPMVLSDGDTVTLSTGTVTYQVLSSSSYVGLMMSESPSRMGLAPGQQAEIGREPKHPGLPLPDRRGQENIRWCPGFRAARARSSGFTMDRALAGRRQAAIRLAGDAVIISNLHDRCKTYLADGGTLKVIEGDHGVSLGAIIVTGTSVIAVREPS